LDVALVFDELASALPDDAPEDLGAEYEEERTIEALLEAIRANGHRALALPLREDFPAAVRRAQPDLVFNIAEGVRGPTRESIVPAWLDHIGVPYTGSDGLTLAVSLDKALTKTLAACAGVRTPRFARVGSLGELDAVELEFPLFVKPNAEGSSMGVRQSSLVRDRHELARQVGWALETYGEDCLVEEFAPGPEFCVAMLGNGEPELLPVAELRSPSQFYSFEYKGRHNKELVCPADLDETTAERLRQMGLKVFRLLRCRDLARADFKLDAQGLPSFLEINPLPGLSPFYGIFPRQALAGGYEHAALIGRIIELALERTRKAEETRWP